MLSKYNIRTLDLYRNNTTIYFFSDNKMRYFTQPLNDKKNVMIATNNNRIKKYIKETHKTIITHAHPLFVVKNISEQLSMDLVLLLDFECQPATDEISWDIHFVVSSPDSRKYMYESWKENMSIKYNDEHL